MSNNNLWLIIVCILMAGCGNQKDKSEADNNIADSVASSLIQSPKTPAFNDQFIDGQPVYSYLKNSNIPQEVLKYYYGDFEIEENDQTRELLRILIEGEQNLKPFYYRCFVDICADADTTLSSFLGKYAVEMVEENTEYVMQKLNSGSPDFFTGLISNYFYQDKSWEEDVNNLSVRLHQNLEHSTVPVRRELDLFIVGIKNDIEHIIRDE